MILESDVNGKREFFSPPTKPNIDANRESDKLIEENIKHTINSLLDVKSMKFSVNFTEISFAKLVTLTSAKIWDKDVYVAVNFILKSLDDRLAVLKNEIILHLKKVTGVNEASYNYISESDDFIKLFEVEFVKLRDAYNEEYDKNIELAHSYSSLEEKYMDLLSSAPVVEDASLIDNALYGRESVTVKQPKQKVAAKKKLVDDVDGEDI